jgi:hypothetical protein
MPLETEANEAVGGQRRFHALAGRHAPKDVRHGVVHDLNLPFVKPQSHGRLFPVEGG